MRAHWELDASLARSADHRGDLGGRLQGRDRRYTAPEAVSSGSRIRERLWVVVVTYNGAPWIAECVRSVMCPLVEQVTVVDNASTDDTVEIIRALHLPVTIITLPRNIGFGRANNIAIQHAREAGAGYVLLLNQDAIIDETSLSILCEAMDDSPDFGILSAIWVDYAGSRTDPIFRLLIAPEFWDDLYFGRLSKTYETGIVPAACAIVRAAVFESIGCFDPLFFMYGEDDDLCSRAAAAGWRIGFVARATVRHWHSQIQRDFPFKMQIEKQYGTALLRLKQSPRPLVLRYLGLIRFWLPKLPAEFRPRSRLILIRGLVFVRCVLKGRAILRSRRLLPRTLIERYDPAVITCRQPGRARQSEP